AMPAYTVLISQPAMSSASSTARWIDCTVDSMFTTTPRLSPRDGQEPMPMTSTRFSGESSPTIATIFEVPTSRPTMSLRSSRLAMTRVLLVHGKLGRRGVFHPADGKSVRVAQIHIADSIEFVHEGRRDDGEEAVHPFAHVA